MAKQNNDEMAAALNAMISGAAEPDDVESNAPPAPPPETPQSAQPTPSARPPAPSSAARPAMTRPAQPQVAPTAPLSASAQQSARPGPRTVRPATPTTPLPTAQPTTSSVRQPFFATLRFRQTIIPPLLTGGVLLLIFSALPFVMAADSAFAAIPTQIVWLCVILGVVLLGTAVLNMLVVRKQLQESV